MHTWSITHTSPRCLFVSADSRLTSPCYTDDQTWNLVLNGGEPPALSMETAFGLRARNMRIFPGFGIGGAVRSDPSQFHTQPAVTRIYPNFLQVVFQPLPQLKVRADYWVAESHLLIGRFMVQNTTTLPLEARLRLYGLLQPDEGGEGMGGRHQLGVNYLAGRTGNLNPVLFLGGGAQLDQTIYPALWVSMQLQQGEARSITWVHASLDTSESSFDAAREGMNRSLDAELARIELTNSSQIEIQTGDPDWDLVLAFSQREILRSFLTPKRRMKHPSFVLTRIPERGYSAIGDGKEYGWQWAGQTAQDAYLYIPDLLMSAPSLAKAVLRNFFDAQYPDGSIDWRPGLAGQRNGALCTPLLATMLWRMHEQMEDRGFLEENFAVLESFIKAWFSVDHDHDQDQVPEWDHTAQMGFDDCPTFVQWETWGQGLDIRTAETPDLASYLYRECQSLAKIARELGDEQAAEAAESRAAVIQERLEAAWSQDRKIYQYVDRDTHETIAGELLGEGDGELVLEIGRTFDRPVRILVRCQGGEELSRAAQVFIHGRGARGRPRVEKLRGGSFRWFWTQGSATSEKTYVELERIEVRGLPNGIHTQVCVADYSREDVTGLLPLWAGIPSHTQAEEMLALTILDPARFWRSSGIPSVSAHDRAYDPAAVEGAGAVEMFWNVLLMEGLVDYGFREEAAALFRKLIRVVARSLRENNAFHQSYHADEPKGIREQGSLRGTIPVHSFLRLLGVQLLSPQRVIVHASNPFPWPVEITWRGLVVRSESERVFIQFPDGSRTELSPIEPALIEQASD